MRHYVARQRQSDGRYDYVSEKGDDVYPIGYCCAFRDPAEYEKLGIQLDEQHKIKLREHAAKFHTDGHATPEEACACYREYLLDFHLQFHSQDEERRRCAVCKEWTGQSASVDMQHWILCEQHCTREEVAKLLPPVHESWRS